MDVFIVTDDIRYGFEKLLPFDLVVRRPIIIGAADGEDVCGFMAVMASEFEWYIEYLFVGIDYRRQGVASAMVKYLMDEISTFGIRNLVAEFTWRKKNRNSTSLKMFFSAFGFFETGEGEIYTISLEDLDRKKFAKVSDSKSLIPLSKATEVLWDELVKNIERTAMRGKFDHEDTNVYIDISNRSEYLQDRSYIYIDDIGSPAGCILLKENGDAVMVEYLYVKKSSKNLHVMDQLLSALYLKNRSMFLGDEKIYINISNKKILPILEHLTNNNVKLYGKEMEFVI